MISVPPLLIILLALAFLFFLALFLFFRLAPQIGGQPNGERLHKMQSFSHYKDGKFHNTEPTDMTMGPAKIVQIIRASSKSGVQREPKRTIPTQAFDQEAWKTVPSQEIGLCWFGHSSLLLKVNGQTLLIDPVFGKRASMFSFLGPKRFDYSHHTELEELPKLDALILSHDHYDHLDYSTIKKMVTGNLPVFTKLGVGSHLEKWGMDPKRIHELGWWQEMNFQGFRMISVPSRHFSGRGLTNRFSTLWGAWIFDNGEQKVFFGSDSGYFPGFKEIGERFGPFDLSLLECGAYSKFWPEIHMMPEETLKAHQDLGGKVLMPIHWGKFNLAQHAWTEPVERLQAAAQKQNSTVMTPQIGEIVTLNDRLPQEPWWKEI